MRLWSASKVTDAQIHIIFQPNRYIILYLYFQGQQCQKDKVGPNLLQKAKKSLTSSFESFISKRVSSDFTVILKERGMISDLSLFAHRAILHIWDSCFEVFPYQQPKKELLSPDWKHKVSWNKSEKFLILVKSENKVVIFEGNFRSCKLCEGWSLLEDLDMVIEQAFHAHCQICSSERQFQVLFRNQLYLQRACKPIHL